jgi:hypothetical protein
MAYKASVQQLTLVQYGHMVTAPILSYSTHVIDINAHLLRTKIQCCEVKLTILQLNILRGKSLKLL